MDIRPLSEQTLMNGYVFAMIMREPRFIRPLLEAVVGRSIRGITMAEPEKTQVPKEVVSDIIGVTLPQFENVLSLIKEHPDWDDRQIAGAAQWRKYGKYGG
ncbi:MAG: hypothetical protein IKP40_11140 [Clostridia bacterium]|nr:hypothetical protein [Clostridia bacterium]